MNLAPVNACTDKENMLHADVPKCSHGLAQGTPTNNQTHGHWNLQHCGQILHIECTSSYGSEIMSRLLLIANVVKICLMLHCLGNSDWERSLHMFAVDVAIIDLITCHI